MDQTFEKYFDRLWPICRSITGDGLRKSLHIIKELIPIKVHEVPTGTEIYDWTVPKEWNIRDAYIVTPNGKKIAEFSKNNLHVVNYSTPIDAVISFEDLEKKLHILPKLPEAVPYVTTYYKEDWGFCLAHKELKKLPRQGKYKVFIDSSLTNGSLSYGDFVLKGDTDKEILFSTYLCHPSLAHNELSGPLVLAGLFKKLSTCKQRRYTYRFLFAPETIGTLSYLKEHGTYLKSNLMAGYVVTCVGASGPFTYKRSKRGMTEADRVAEHILKYSKTDHQIIDFSIGGSDERQFCSPGFNLPVGSLMTIPYKEYPEYHTSLDNKKFISFSQIQKSIDMYFDIALGHEMNQRYKGTILYGEPRLGKRGLYPSSITGIYEKDDLFDLLHFLCFADGNTDLLSIAERKNKSLLEFKSIVSTCKEKGLIE